jgi:hypothetical protein
VAIITVERSEIDDGYFEMAEALNHGDPEPFASLFAEDAECAASRTATCGGSARPRDAAPTRPVRS